MIKISRSFDIGQLRALLANSAFAKNIEYFQKTSSTQHEAKCFVQKNGVFNALFIADTQTSGHGRNSRCWYDTGLSALTFSVLFRPKISLSKTAFINYAAGVAMKETLLHSGISTELKWPNDIMLAGKKLCGMLAETATVLDSLFFAILGIGLNVNSKKCDFPPEVADIATSLKIETGKEFSREELLASFIQNFEANISLLENDSNVFLDKYRQQCDTLRKPVRITDENGEILCMAENINSDGSLLTNKNGERKSFFAADIVHLRNA